MGYLSIVSVKPTVVGRLRFKAIFSAVCLYSKLLSSAVPCTVLHGGLYNTHTHTNG